MTVANAARTIQLILAPAIMVTASAILTSGILGHYAAINDRVRAMLVERLGLLREHTAGGSAPAVAALNRERLEEIDVQIPRLLRRHHLVQRALLTIYTAVGMFVSSMFVIAFAALTSSRAAGTAALFVFLGGTALVLFGVVIVSVEIRMSRDALRYEAQRAFEIGRSGAPT